MTCGEKIAKLRKQNGMTQAELGDELNVTYQAVSKWERGESHPDFDTISRISRLFQVPISYFEDGAEESRESVAEPAEEIAATDTQAVVPPEVVGMCTECGKVVYAGQEGKTSPKLVCRACVERKANEERNAREDAERQKRNELDRTRYELRHRRNRGLIFATIPAAILLIISIVSAITSDNDNGAVFGGGIILTVLAYVFTAQMIWDGTVREVCTAGGHVMSLPGVIFSLSPDGLIFLIVAKLFLALVAGLVFVGSIIVCALAAIIISPFTFVPSLLIQNRNIRRVGK